MMLKKSIPGLFHLDRREVNSRSVSESFGVETAARFGGTSLPRTAGCFSTPCWAARE
jgi:hypothetical protein